MEIEKECIACFYPFMVESSKTGMETLVCEECLSLEKKRRLEHERIHGKPTKFKGIDPKQDIEKRAQLAFFEVFIVIVSGLLGTLIQDFRTSAVCFFLWCGLVLYVFKKRNP